MKLLLQGALDESAEMDEAGDGASGEETQEFPIFVRKRPNEAYSVMNFRCTEDVVFAEWREARMRREDNSHSQERGVARGSTGSSGESGRRQPLPEKQQPQQSAYRPQDQPWLLRVDGRRRRTFRSRREGGISDHSAYYVFAMKADGTIEASPVGEWHTFEPLHTYRTLSIEEAEQLYKNRDKKLDYFAVMIQKRLNDAKAEEEEGERAAACEAGGSGAFETETGKRDGNAAGSSADEDDEGARKKSLREQSRAKMNRLYSGESDDELIGEMDDDDDTSDSSQNEDEDETHENKEEKEGDEKEGEKTNAEGGAESADNELEEGEIPEKKERGKDDVGAAGSEPCSSSQAAKGEAASGGGDKDRSARHHHHHHHHHKRRLLGSVGVGGEGGGGAGGDWRAPRAPLPPELAALEEAARRHLRRRPVTVQQLLRRLKPHRRGLPAERVVEAVARVLRSINPRRRLVHGKMFLFLD